MPRSSGSRPASAMLSRKQQWRRVRCRRRLTLAIPPLTPPKLSTCDITSELGKSSSASTEKCSDDDISSSCTALSTWSSFDSCESVLEEAVDPGEGEVDDAEALRNDGGGCGGGLSPPASPPVATVDVRGKGVTFEPRVQVFLVTHKNELDHRAKQALWWTGRDAAMNKRAWLNHLGQPGCGRQSAGQSRRQQQQYHQARAGLYGSGHITAGGMNVGGGGGGYGGLSSAHGTNYDAGLLAVGGGEGGGGGDADQTVGILGCRCWACLTEGDEHEQLKQQQQRQQQQQQRQRQRQQEELQYDAYATACYRGDYYSTATASGGGDRGASMGWPCAEQWQMEGDDLEERGSLSYSPASSRSDSPMRDAYDESVFSSNAYFWD